MRNDAAFTSDNGLAKIQSRSVAASKFVAPIAAAALAFFVDVRTPNGVIDGFLYVLVVLAFVRVPGTRASVYAAVGLTPLIAAGFALSPSEAPIWAAVTNRLVSILAVWAAAWVVQRNAIRVADDEHRLLSLQRQISNRIIEVDALRVELSTWLQTEVCRELEIVDWQIRHLPRPGRRSTSIHSDVFLVRRAIERATNSVRRKSLRMLGTESGSSIGMSCSQNTVSAASELAGTSDPITIT